MSENNGFRRAAAQVLDKDEVEGVLSGRFYGAAASEPGRRERDAKPTHYKVICISMYIDALERLDVMVKELKKRGYTKANRSALIRHALECVDLDKVPRGI